MLKCLHVCLLFYCPAFFRWPRLQLQTALTTELLKIETVHEEYYNKLCSGPEIFLPMKWTVKYFYQSGYLCRFRSSIIWNVFVPPHIISTAEAEWGQCWHKREAPLALAYLWEVPQQTADGEDLQAAIRFHCAQDQVAYELIFFSLYRSVSFQSRFICMELWTIHIEAALQKLCKLRYLLSETDARKTKPPWDNTRKKPWDEQRKEHLNSGIINH